MSGLPTIPTIAETNRLTLEKFTSVVSLLFEPTAVLTKRIYDQRPFASYDQLLDTAGAEIKKLTPEELLEVINAHPRIGEKATNLSALSKIEQGQRASNEDEILAKWAELNKRYEDKYGFRFVIFVNGRKKESLFPIVEERIAHGDRTTELLTGLSDMVEIARDRANKLLAASASCPSPNL